MAVERPRFTRRRFIGAGLLVAGIELTACAVKPVIAAIPVLSPVPDTPTPAPVTPTAEAPKPTAAPTATVETTATIPATATAAPKQAEIPTVAPPTRAPEPTSTFTPTTTPTPARPTEIPTPQTGYVLENGLPVFRTEKGDRLNVPQIPGLRAELRDFDGQKKVIYLAKKDNPYGLKEIEYAGEFFPNVSMTTETGKQEQTGGVVLTAPVVSQLIQENLATIPNQKDKWVIVIPEDIRGNKPTEGVNLGFEESTPLKGAVMLKITNTADEFSVVNIIPKNTSLRVLKNTYFGWIYIDQIRMVQPYTNPIYPGKEMQYITVAGNIKGFSTNTNVERSFGQEVAKANGPIRVVVGAAQESLNTTPDKILRVGKVPIFLAANKS